jgi:serine/threonine-protein kinase
MKEILNNVVGGRYYVLSLLGKGGFSNVYKVKDIQTGKLYALKQYITSDPANKERLLEGMEKELNVLKHTSHPVLPKLYNIIKEEESFFLILEYVEGINLKQYVKSKGRMKGQEVLSVMEQVCSGLYYLHSIEPPVVYRDLKPSNIILMSNGKVKLIDFGIAKRYNHEFFSGETAYGTKGFAAPEQMGNSKGINLYNTDIRTDIYGIGATLYFLKTGKIFDGKVKKIMSYKMKKLIKKCTEPNPDLRYQNCMQILCVITAMKRTNNKNA